LIHVPHQKQGKRIRCNAQQADIAPTIVDLLGLPDPGWFDGESLKLAMVGDYLSNKPKYSMNLESNKPDQIGVLQTRSVAVIRNQYKYIYYIDKDFGELFDLVRDPKEKNNLVQQERLVAGELRSLIVKNVLKR
jgi:arylsulfatase A-like enzyme